MPWVRRHTVWTMLSVAAVGAAAAPQPAGDDAARHARNLAASCTACHAATAGAPDDGSRLHSLAGWSEADLLAALRAYRSSDRRGDVMVQLTKGYSDAQLAQIAAALAAGAERAAP